MFTFTEEERENLKEWADFLHITTLKQGHNNLFMRIRSADSDCSLTSEKSINNPENYAYCCLGIWGLVKYSEDIFSCTNPYVSYIESSRSKGFLSHVYAKELGLCSNDALQQRDFTLMNDQLKWSFKEIAMEIYHILEYGEFSERFTSSKITWEEEQRRLLKDSICRKIEKMRNK